MIALLSLAGCNFRGELSDYCARTGRCACDGGDCCLASGQACVSGQPCCGSCDTMLGVCVSPAAGGDSGTPDSGTPDSGTPDSGTLHLLSDEFEDPGAELHPRWQSILRASTVAVRDGGLEIRTTGFQVWRWLMFADGGVSNSIATFVWQPVTGNFRVTATLRAGGIDDITRFQTRPDGGPLGQRQAGLAARLPQPDGFQTPESWVGVFAGAGPFMGSPVPQVAPVFEVTSAAVDGGTTLDRRDASDNFAEVRLCRVGAVFIALGRRPDAGWPAAPLATWLRPDLPATLQVGPSVSVGSEAPFDMVARFELVRFADLTDAGDCSLP